MWVGRVLLTRTFRGGVQAPQEDKQEIYPDDLLASEQASVLYFFYLCLSTLV
jgi:hypothetical protein